VSAGALCFRGGDDGQVARNPRRAFELYQHAGELGSVEGWRNVVACYATGQGVPQSFETAKYVARTMLPTEEAY
jgi:TPR repeat protein